MLSHPEEKYTTMVLFHHLYDAPEATDICVFKDENEAIVSYFSAYESDNEDLELDEPYDEFFVVAVKIEKLLKEGNPPMKEGDIIDIWYTNFPVKIIADDDTVIYSAQEI